VARGRRPSLGALFILLGAGFAGIAVFAATEGGGAWVVALAAGVIALWLAELAFRALR
jgi:hypothetical protein